MLKVFVSKESFVGMPMGRLSWEQKNRTREVTKKTIHSNSHISNKYSHQLFHLSKCIQECLFKVISHRVNLCINNHLIHMYLSHIYLRANTSHKDSFHKDKYIFHLKSFHHNRSHHRYLRCHYHKWTHQPKVTLSYHHI